MNEKSTRVARGEADVTRNRRVTFDYAIEERIECGIVLVGSEVKALRQGLVDLTDAYASIDNGQLFLKQLHVGQWSYAKAFPHEERRGRKLLAHRHEIEKLEKELTRGGMTLVPSRIYFKNGRVKIELVLGTGKKKFDKRADIAKKTAEREAKSEMDRARKTRDR
jgi:SsrA-binding protein